MPEPLLLTSRLHLRPIDRQDIDALMTYCADLALSRWMTHIPHPYTQADAEDYVARASAKPGRVWGIAMNNALIGTMGTVGEFGYWIGRPFWRQGIASEAGVAVLYHYFTNPDHDQITARHAVANAASGALLRKLGFEDTGPATTSSKATGETLDARAVLLT
ncbi:MAG: GNAT family N-acetyltransferase, partial [Pseudomonadota bacterium]